MTCGALTFPSIRPAPCSRRSAGCGRPWRRASAAGARREPLRWGRAPPRADFADAWFAQPAIARLAEQRLIALEDHAEARLALGEHSLLAGELSELVARHPLRERLRATHMLALYRS